MANIRKASNKKPKGVNFNKGKKQFVKETVKKEVDAVKKVLDNLKKLRQDYIKIYNMGDKTLKAKHFNKYYEIFLNAEKEITTLHRTLDAHQRSTAMLDNINEGRYHDWRNDESMTPKQKIGRSMREIRDALNELDKTVKMNLKLKTELKMKSEDYWKNTHKALTKISERLVKMANKVGNLK
jgi:chaperonin cofactor prefoldin